MKKIAVIGAGTMGNGIAHVFAQKKYQVHLIDTQKTALEKAIKTISGNLDRQIKKEIITATDKLNTLNSITSFTSIEQGVLDVDLVIEAATEKLKKTENDVSSLNNVLSTIGGADGSGIDPHKLCHMDG